MLTYIFKRTLFTIPVGLAVVTIVSLMIHAVPGNPVDSILGDYSTLEEKKLLATQLGLNQPLWQQWLTYVGDLTKGDLQNSLIYNQPVAELIASRAGPTIELAALSIITAIVLSIPLGVLSAVYKGKFPDYLAMTGSLLGVAIPNFWLGPMLILLFSVWLGWLPVSERTSFSSYILPAITLGTSLAAILSRMTRNSVLEVMKEDYVRTAKAKGQSSGQILFFHVLRNASLPLVSLIGLQFGVLLTGAVITEKIFDWPGLGTLMLEGLGQRDYPLVQGCVLVFSASYLVVNLITDLTYAVIDPRINLTSAGDSK